MKYTLLLLTLILTTAQANLITLDTRLGVTQQILIEQPDNSKANLILFAGGKGKLKLGSDKYKSNGNFLIRTCSGLTNLDTKIALYPSRGY